MSLTPKTPAWLLALLVIGLIASPVAQAQSAKFAVISTQEIIEQSDTGKAAIQQLRTLQEEKTAEVRALQQEINDLRTRINEGRLSLAEDTLRDLQEQLDTKGRELPRRQEDAAAELEKRQVEVLGNIEKQVMPIIQQIGEEEGYTMIFRKFESGLVYVDDTVDITDQVIQRLDQANASAAGSEGS